MKLKFCWTEAYYSGASPVFGRGGAKNFEICMIKRMAKPCALLGGFWGMPPRENFLKWCNLVRFGVYFDQILSLRNFKNYHFLYKKFKNCNFLYKRINMVQLGPRYEGQLNPMAEPIPHEVRPLVRTHVYHPYHARTDRQRPIVEFNRRGRVFAPFCGCSLKSRECYNHGPRMASS